MSDSETIKFTTPQSSEQNAFKTVATYVPLDHNGLYSGAYIQGLIEQNKIMKEALEKYQSLGLVKVYNGQWENWAREALEKCEKME